MRLYLLVWEVDQVGVGVLGAGAVEPLVAVLALEAEALPLVDRPDVLLEADLGGELLPAQITYHSASVLRLLVSEIGVQSKSTWPPPRRYYSLIKLVGFHKCLVAAGFVALPFSEIFMNCLDVVPEGVDAFQHLATFITGLQICLLILREGSIN